MKLLLEWRGQHKNFVRNVHNDRHSARLRCSTIIVQVFVQYFGGVGYFVETQFWFNMLYSICINCIKSGEGGHTSIIQYVAIINSLKNFLADIWLSKDHGGIQNYLTNSSVGDRYPTPMQPLELNKGVVWISGTTNFRPSPWRTLAPPVN
jgi:hypothetical protein